MGSPNNTSRSKSKSVSAAVEAEHEKLRAWGQANKMLLEAFLDSYCIVDRNNRVIDFNVAFTELTGESYRKILKIGDFCALINTEQCPHQCPGRQIIDSNKGIRIDELTGSSKAYPNLSLILAGTPIQDSSGKLVGAFVTIRNVSAESELQKKYYERKEESVVDGLTRLVNKKYSEEALMKILKASLRDGQVFSVMMCDIDHFKKVNDNYGHQAGDYVLSAVARILKEESRDSDVVGRFGGEEFIAILSNTDTAGTRVFGERFRQKIAATEFLFEGKRIPVTISLGSASFTEKWTPAFNAEKAIKELVKNADTALYQAKAGGRNQLCQFEAATKKPDDKKSEAA